MKKFLFILLAIVMIASLSVTALAQPAATNKNGLSDQSFVNQMNKFEKNLDKTANPNSKKSEALIKKAEFKKFHIELKKQRNIIKKNRLENAKLVKDNLKLRIQLQKQLKNIQKAGMTLSAEDVAQLKTYNQQIKDLIASIEAGAGKIKEILAANSQNISAKNYEAILAAYTEIEKIQAERNTQLQQINDILKSMSELLEKAATAAPTATPVGSAAPTATPSAPASTPTPEATPAPTVAPTV